MGKTVLVMQPGAGQQPSHSVAASSPPRQEPSAAPLQAQEPSINTIYQRAEDESDQPSPRVPLGIFLLDKLINGTIGSLTIDLKRPQLPRSGTQKSLFTTTRVAANLHAGAHPHPHPHRRGRPSRQVREQRRQFIDYSELPNLAFGNSGARIKVMRHVKFGPEFTHTTHGRTLTEPLFDFGGGLEFEFDTADLRPKLRLKVREVAALQALPHPALRVQRRVQLGSSGWGVRLSYECPLERLHQFYAPPARFMVSLDNSVDTGVNLTQSGVEMRVNEWLGGNRARVKAAGMLKLPSELPIEEDDMLVKFEVRRLGLKTRW